MLGLVNSRNRLTLRGRRKAWQVAREAYLESGRDKDEAYSLAVEKLKNLEIPPIVIEIMLSIIIKLIVQWIMDKYVNPPEENPLLEGVDEDE